MKNLFIFILTLFSTFALFTKANAQMPYHFSLDTLERLCKMNSHEFDRYVVDKNYKYAPAFSDGETMFFVPNQQLKFGENYSISLTQIPKKHPVAGFGTTDIGYFSGIRKQLENNWKFMGEVPTANGWIFYHYENAEYHVTIYSFSVGNGAYMQYNVQCYSLN